MPQNAKTQALLDSVKKPKHASRADVDASVIDALMPLITKCHQEAAELQLLVYQARNTEPDADLSGRFEQVLQTARSIQRVAKDLEKSGAELMLCFAQLDRYDADIRSLAVEKGYEG